ncbi:MAG: endonuclease [Bacteroidetes bacterium]|nr:MAG: endonuclease [Bacteroidota bacterium]
MEHLTDFKINDFVISITEIEHIEKRSVGLIEDIVGERCVVFFIGKKQRIETHEENLTFLDVKKTGKPYNVKICNICHILKDENEFDINQTDAKGRKTTRPSCKICRIDIDGASLITEDAKKMNQAKPQNLFVCPICEKMSIVDVTANIVKDHDHQTGKGREWICDSCNTGLGRFKDDITLLQKAIAYIQKHSKND